MARNENRCWLHHGVENAVSCLAQQLDGLPGRTVLHRGHDALRMSSSVSFTSTPSAVDSPTARVGVDGQNTLGRVRFSQQPHKGGGDGGLATPPLPATAMILGECSNKSHVLSCYPPPSFLTEMAAMPQKYAGLCSIVKFLTSYYHKYQQIAMKVSAFCCIFW